MTRLSDFEGARCTEHATLARTLLLATLMASGLVVTPAEGQQPGRAAPSPIEPYLNGVFPSAPPGQANSWRTVRAFPDLTFTDPISMAPWPGTNDLLLVERLGRLVRFPNRQSATTNDVSVILNWRARTQASADDGGFYAVAFHPRFADPVAPRRFLFLCYTHKLQEGVNHPDGSSYWRLVRLEVDPHDAIIPDSETILISLYDPQGWHNGGAMFFGADGFLYLSNGDGGSAYDPFENGQALDKSLFSAVIRIDVDQVGGYVSHPIRRQPREVAPLPEGVSPSFTRNYFIPSDNPWVEDPGGGGEAPFMEEIIACGLRSPHSMHYDRESGQVWIGDVGQNSREELDLLVLDPARPVPPGKGRNFGWSTQEGDLGSDLPPDAPGIPTRPILSYPRSVGQCIITGGVYRGGKFDLDLGGKVLLADNRTARIWTVDYRPGHEPVLQELTTLSDGEALTGRGGRGLTNFCRDQHGEVYLIYSSRVWDPNGRIYTLEAGTTNPEPPALLSGTGAFTDLASLTPAPFLLPYTVNTPLWSDRALKSRWIALPNDGSHDTLGEQITYREHEPWTFPAGTVLVKHFELPTQALDPSQTTRLETRFIVCLPEGRHYGVTYRWREDGSEADLLTGAQTGTYLVTHADGSTAPQSWQFPGRTDCRTCHNSVAGQALGVRTPQLNGTCHYPDTGITAHQLETWNALGMFDLTLSASHISNTIRSASLRDRTIPLEHRIRSYLDSNCSHCHQPGGPGPGFDARLAVPLRDQHLINEPLRPDIEGRFDLRVGNGEDGQVIPGAPALSAVHFRLAHAQPDAAAMPPLAKNLVDHEAVAAMTSWIEGLDPADLSDSTAVRASLGGPTGMVDGRFSVSVIFDRNVGDFDAGDLMVVNGMVTDVAGSGYQYVARILPTGSPITVELPANTLGANGNLASNRLTVPFMISLSAGHDPASGLVILTWPSQSNLRYNLRSSPTPIGNPLSWSVVEGHADISGTEPRNTLTLIQPPGTTRYFVIEGYVP